jgi:hypothetical protein
MSTRGLPLSVLVVDVSVPWEEALKDLERGYSVWNWHESGERQFQRGEVAAEAATLKYPHGSARAGFDAIVDVMRLASTFGLPCYGVDSCSPWTCDDPPGVCFSLRPYVPQGNVYTKYDYGAFGDRCDLGGRLMSDGCRHLLIVGYDRDCCVLETARGAVERGMKVVTSEHCMLTVDRRVAREESLRYYRGATCYLESLVAVFRYLHRHRVRDAVLL